MLCSEVAATPTHGPGVGINSLEAEFVRNEGLFFSRVFNPGKDYTKKIRIPDSLEII